MYMYSTVYSRYTSNVYRYIYTSICSMHRSMKLEASYEYFIGTTACQYKLVPRSCQAGMEGFEHHVIMTQETTCPLHGLAPTSLFCVL